MKQLVVSRWLRGDTWTVFGWRMVEHKNEMVCDVKLSQPQGVCGFKNRSIIIIQGGQQPGGSSITVKCL